MTEPLPKVACQQGLDSNTIARWLVDRLWDQVEFLSQRRARRRVMVPCNRLQIAGEVRRTGRTLVPR